MVVACKEKVGRHIAKSHVAEGNMLTIIKTSGFEYLHMSMGNFSDLKTTLDGIVESVHKLAEMKVKTSVEEAKKDAKKKAAKVGTSERKTGYVRKFMGRVFL